MEELTDPTEWADQVLVVRRPPAWEPDSNRVAVLGNVDPTTGYVADLGVITQLVVQHVVNRLDHRNLNRDVPEFADRNPTAENIAVMIWGRLVGVLPAPLVRITLWETPRNVVIYEGE